jgi:tripartite-type tricarboxylate transporter receptor subunit TctC
MWLMPKAESASTTALTTAAGEPMVPTSPQPFTPMGVCTLGVLCVDTAIRGKLSARQLGPLAVTSATRWAGLPESPTVSESVPGYESSAWYGIGAPRNTPTDIIGKLNREINSGLADPKLTARLADLGAVVVAGSPADFGRLIADETEKWAQVIRTSNIKTE